MPCREPSTPSSRRPPDKNWTFRDLVMSLTDKRTVGTPEQIADALEKWRDLGVNGISVNTVGGWGDIFDFADNVTPVLQPAV